MSKKSIGIALWVVILLSMVWSVTAKAQDGGWSEPYQLSSETGKSSEGYLAADPYGYVHLFWTETGFTNHLRIIKYARFDGGTWTIPNDIYATSEDIANVSPFVDQDGTLHIAWAEGLYGPAFYSHAPANDAMSAQNWTKPIQINVPARFVQLLVDKKGVIHLLYFRQMDDPGVFYTRSVDQGLTWSKPIWLDPDIPSNHTPASLNFMLDDSGGLHAVWSYGALGENTPDTGWIRYSHSLDSGKTWSHPFTIDKYIEGSDNNPNNASPVMAVSGLAVNVIWAAGEQPYRYYRYSTDAGQTWSEPKHIFGDLHGQAFDGLAVDGSGRIHYFAQIRYPLAIYHSYWEVDHWTQPSMVYFIQEEGGEMGDRIHAHHTHPIVRAGNQLVLSFADSPSNPDRRLFAMFRTLDDLSPSPLAPTPTPSATPLPKPSPTPTHPAPLPTLMATAPVFEQATTQPAQDASRPDLILLAALVPNLLLFGGAVVLQLVNKLKR